MKKILSITAFVLLAVDAFSQFVDRSDAIQAVRRDTFSLHHTDDVLLQNTTFSNTHVLYPVSEYGTPSRTVVGSMLWGGIAGTAFGATIVLSDANTGYRPKSSDVLTFAALGAGAGIVVGFVTGIIKAAKRKKSNTL